MRLKRWFFKNNNTKENSIILLAIESRTPIHREVSCFANKLWRKEQVSCGSRIVFIKFEFSLTCFKICNCNHSFFLEPFGQIQQIRPIQRMAWDPLFWPNLPWCTYKLDYYLRHNSWKSKLTRRVEKIIGTI